jgi:zinc protease
MKTNLTNASSIRALVAALLLLIAPSALAQKPDRSKPPELGTPPSLNLPSIQKFTLSNGIPVVVMERHNVPLVQMNLVIRAGSAFESAEKVGLASLTAAMLKEGAGSFSSLELADAIDYLGAFIGAAPGSHTIEVLLHSPLSKFDKAFDLFADIILRPTFPGKELERLKKERLTALVQMYDQPTMVAAVASSKFVFGEQHPYGRGTMGTEQTIKSFTVEDVKGFYSKYFNASNATFIVVGDVKPAEVVSKLEKAFGGWAKGNAANVKVPSADQVKGRTVYLIDKPDAPQSVVRIARVGVARTTADYFPLMVMNTILGGSFSSRLNINLREKHGYTYGAGSGFDMRPAPGAFTANSSVQTAVTDKAMSEFMTEFKAILEQVSDQELTRAKNYLALGYPGGFETVSQVASELSEMVLYNLPDSYFNTYIKNVLAVSKADVQRVAKKYIDPENIAIIVVGDRKSIEKGLADLKLGTIKNLKIEDVLGKMPVIQ